jgi:hypothetical protein
MTRVPVLLILLVLSAFRIEGDTVAATSDAQDPVPRRYVCMRAPSPPAIDGRLDDAAWSAAAWTADFVDIEGDVRPRPSLRTRAKLLWDDDWLYIAGEIEEPHVWGTLTERDAVIFHDDDFEVFIDPDGDTHQYYEIEINAFGTVWDLLLVKPYRDGGPAIDAWDIAGLRSAVHIAGTLNDPSDGDTGWTVELAIPWSILEETAPDGKPPRPGDTWRINFSRVDWDMRIDAGTYAKVTDRSTGRPLPEHNWVWSPQGAIDMHRPELWGMVQFSAEVAGTSSPTFEPPPDEDVRMALRAVYHAQRAHHERTGAYASDATMLDLNDATRAALRGLRVAVTQAGWEASVAGSESGTVWHIREDGRITLRREGDDV